MSRGAICQTGFLRENRVARGSAQRALDVARGLRVVESLVRCRCRYRGPAVPVSIASTRQIYVTVLTPTYPGHDLVSTTTSTLTTILNTVAPPISAHETLELWLSHPMVGYQGVESVVYRAWTRVLEQTESGELVVVWSAPPEVTETKRGMYPVQGWEIGWEAAGKEMEAIKAREEKDPQGRGKEPNREWTSPGWTYPD